MKMLYIFLGIALIAFIVFGVWNIVTLRRIANSNEKPNSTENYFELKYKIQYLIAVFVVIGSALGAFGYSTIEDVRADIKDQLSDDITTLEKTINMKTKEADSLVNKLEKLERDLARVSENDLNEIIDQAASQKREISQIEKIVTQLKNKNILKRSFYVVNSIEFSYQKNVKAKGDLSKYETVYFKDLKTNIGDNLPKFKEPPFLITSSSTSSAVKPFNINKEFFQVILDESILSTFDGDTILFDLLIVEN